MLKGNKISKPSDLLEKLRQIKALADQCIGELAGSFGSRRQTRQHSPRPTPPRTPKLNFDAHARAFVKANVGDLAGPGKFVLILAYLAKGDTGREVPLKEVRRTWNRMTSLLEGEFNRKYTNDAKERGWVNTKKTGVYVLTTTWKDIFIR